MVVGFSTQAKMSISPPCVLLPTDYVATGNQGRRWTRFTDGYAICSYRGGSPK
jgi:hypothetical protein